MKNDNQFDWTINVNKQGENDEFVIYKTDGFAKYRGGEVVVYGKASNSDKTVKMINAFCNLCKNGEVFAVNATHRIDDNNSNENFIFILVLGESLNGEKWLQLIPAFYD